MDGFDKVGVLYSGKLGNRSEARASDRGLWWNRIKLRLYEGKESEYSPRTCSIGRPAGGTLCPNPIILKSPLATPDSGARSSHRRDGTRYTTTRDAVPCVWRRWGARVYIILPVICSWFSSIGTRLQHVSIVMIIIRISVTITLITLIAMNTIG